MKEKFSFALNFSIFPVFPYSKNDIFSSSIPRVMAPLPLSPSNVTERGGGGGGGREFSSERLVWEGEGGGNEGFFPPLFFEWEGGAEVMKGFFLPLFSESERGAWKRREESCLNSSSQILCLSHFPLSHFHFLFENFSLKFQYLKIFFCRNFCFSISIPVFSLSKIFSDCSLFHFSHFQFSLIFLSDLFRR